MVRANSSRADFVLVFQCEECMAVASFRARQIGLQFQLFGRSGSASALKLQIYVRAVSDAGPAMSKPASAPTEGSMILRPIARLIRAAWLNALAWTGLGFGQAEPDRVAPCALGDWASDPGPVGPDGSRSRGPCHPSLAVRRAAGRWRLEVETSQPE